MSYTIIFETKVVKLSDGRLLHLDLSGCNNDNAGRDRGEFKGKIYEVSEFEKYVDFLTKHSRPINKSDGFDLKIGNKYSTWYDYGSHLMRMKKRACTWDELLIDRDVSANRYDGVLVIKDEGPVKMTAKEFTEYALSQSHIRYRPLITELENETDIVKALDKNETVEFYIGRKKRRNTRV